MPVVLWHVECREDWWLSSSGSPGHPRTVGGLESSLGLGGYTPCGDTAEPVKMQGREGCDGEWRDKWGEV